MAALLLLPGITRAHAGNFVLAKCLPSLDGTVELQVSVDYSRHPLISDKESAVRELPGVLRVLMASGPVLPGALAEPALTFETQPDPTLPVSSDDDDGGAEHQFAVMRYHWSPDEGDLRFSVPDASPYDVLFWLSGTAVPEGTAVPWQILIAGDQTPTVPKNRKTQGKLLRGIGAGMLILAIAGAVWWRKKNAADGR